MPISEKLAVLATFLHFKQQKIANQSLIKPKESLDIYKNSRKICIIDFLVLNVIFFRFRFRSNKESTASLDLTKSSNELQICPIKKQIVH